MRMWPKWRRVSITLGSSESFILSNWAVLSATAAAGRVSFFLCDGHDDGQWPSQAGSRTRSKPWSPGRTGTSWHCKAMTRVVDRHSVIALQQRLPVHVSPGCDGPSVSIMQTYMHPTHTKYPKHHTTSPSPGPSLLGAERSGLRDTVRPGDPPVDPKLGLPALPCACACAMRDALPSGEEDGADDISNCPSPPSYSPIRSPCVPWLWPCPRRSGPSSAPSQSEATLSPSCLSPCFLPPLVTLPPVPPPTFCSLRGGSPLDVLSSPAITSSSVPGMNSTSPTIAQSAPSTENSIPLSTSPCRP